jgi:sterol desaturase/sphingolipid hydroxylase (fatty acid hydroxylase superfamily)
MLFFAVLFVSLFVASLLGHGIHWAIHQRWMGPAYRGHMQHHLELYPPHDMVSDTYRAAKWYNSGPFLFTPPLVIILGTVGGLLWWVGVPLWVIATFGASLVGFGLLNDWVHDSGHIRNHWASRFGWWRKCRDLHVQHHANMRKNYGIFLFVWDRVFGTFLT